ncbi:Kinase [Hexamita inflata]|uniref:non-specific serine/threonine protein kinase n=1 Tax=Hexamita inflata TaxID=28002 RepID=A0AA86QP62_9EUKA|nr:CAMK CAMKL [Hexamita inflata]
MQSDLQVKRVSNYIFGEFLGRGSLGCVRLATHQITGEKVAIKILEKSKIMKEYTRVIREIQVLKTLNHLNVTKLLEVLDTSHYIFLVTQYAENGELYQYIVKRDKLPEQEACKFFRQLIQAVCYCHMRRVCHRDLKLENILLNANNDLKIIDFGLSNILSQDNDKFQTACGSPSYVAPEVLSGRGYHGPQVDIWSCGIILYAMLCGNLPFEDDDRSQLFKKISNGQFTIPPFISPSASDLIKQILIIDPAKRLTIDQIINHPWFTSTLNEPFIKVTELNTPTKIDFRVVHSMTQAIPEWNPPKIIKAIQDNRHNPMTATYFLLSEKSSEKVWAFEEQEKYARILGYTLSEDGQIESQ